MYKAYKYFAIALGIISLIIMGVLISEGDEAITNSANIQNNWLTPFIYIAYVFFAISLIITLVFVIKGVLSNTHTLKKTLISVGAFLGIVLISYLLASSDVPPGANTPISESGSKWISTGLNMFYILSVLVIVAMIFAAVRKFSNR